MGHARVARQTPSSIHCLNYIRLTPDRFRSVLGQVMCCLANSVAGAAFVFLACAKKRRRGLGPPRNIDNAIMLVAIASPFNVDVKKIEARRIYEVDGIGLHV